MKNVSSVDHPSFGLWFYFSLSSFLLLPNSLSADYNTSWPLSSNSQTLKMLGKKMPGKRHLIFPKYSQTAWTQILSCCPTQRLNSGINSTHDLLNQLSSNLSSSAVVLTALTCPGKFLDLAEWDFSPGLPNETLPCEVNIALCICLAEPAELKPSSRIVSTTNLPLINFMILDLAQSEIFHLAFQLKHFLVKWILHCVFVWLNQLSSNLQAEQWAPLTCPDKFHDFWTWHRVRFFNWPSNWNISLWSEYCTVYICLAESIYKLIQHRQKVKDTHHVMTIWADQLYYTC